MLLLHSLTLLAASTQAATAITVQYCSDENTGSTFNTGEYLYNTLGSCSIKCQTALFSYAIVQNHGCWCSNEAPSHRESIESCNQSCPGYALQTCGSEEAGLFGYVAVSGGSSTTRMPSSATAEATARDTFTPGITVGTQTAILSTLNTTVVSSSSSTAPSVTSMATTSSGTTMPSAETTGSNTSSAMPAAYTGAAGRNMAGWTSLGVVALGGLLSYAFALRI